MISLAEDFRKRFAISSSNSVPTPPASPEPEPEPELDLVVATPPKSKSKSTSKEPSPAVWEANVDAPVNPIPAIKPPSRRSNATPVVLNNRQYKSNATANWSTIRKSLYPVYKEFCTSQGTKPTVYEFNSLIGPRWKQLSAEDKAKAVVNPSQYFSF